MLADDLVRHTLNHVVISASGLLVMDPVTQPRSLFTCKFLQFHAIYFHDLNSLSTLYFGACGRSSHNSRKRLS